MKNILVVKSAFAPRTTGVAQEDERIFEISTLGLFNPFDGDLGRTLTEQGSAYEAIVVASGLAEFDKVIVEWPILGSSGSLIEDPTPKSQLVGALPDAFALFELACDEYLYLDPFFVHSLVDINLLTAEEITIRCIDSRLPKAEGLVVQVAGGVSTTQINLIPQILGQTIRKVNLLGHNEGCLYEQHLKNGGQLTTAQCNCGYLQKNKLAPYANRVLEQHVEINADLRE